jgi:hypothetical protein
MKVLQCFGAPKSSDFFVHYMSVSGSRIAEICPKTTVMFCEIIPGFTVWSALREPWEVFYLLEMIYCSCDVIARKR